RYALTQLARLAPDQSAALTRLAQLGGAEESAASEVLPEFATTNDPSAESHESVTTEFVFETETSDSVLNNEPEFEWNSVAEANEATVATSEGDGFTFENIVAEELRADSIQSQVDDNESRNASLRARELESVDFYIAQGYFDIAFDTLDLLES